MPCGNLVQLVKQLLDDPRSTQSRSAVPVMQNHSKQREGLPKLYRWRITCFTADQILQGEGRVPFDSDLCFDQPDLHPDNGIPSVRLYDDNPSAGAAYPRDLFQSRSLLGQMMQDVATQDDVKALCGERQAIRTRTNKTAPGKLAPCEDKLVGEEVDPKQFGFTRGKEEQISTFATPHFEEALPPAGLNAVQQGPLRL